MEKTYYPKSSFPNQQSDKNIYNSYQGFGMEVGFVMLLIAFTGLFWPRFFNLNLTFMHSLILATSGLLAVWTGLMTDRQKIFRITLGLGVFYLLNAVLGPLVGEPGSGRFGFFSGETIQTTAPGFLELSYFDHLMHSILALAFFREAYFCRSQIRRTKLIPNKFVKIMAKISIAFFMIFLILLLVMQIQKASP